MSEVPGKAQARGLWAARVRRWLRLAAVLATIEGLGLVADWHWSFRARLLEAFDAAVPRNGSADWQDPDRLFEPDYTAFRQVLQFRTGTSLITGQRLDPAELPPGKRVIVLGESAAFGVGVRPEETFSGLLDERLRGSGVRVINGGQIGADAEEVLDAGAHLLKSYSPSTLVLFTGNNLWINWAPPQQREWNPRVIGILKALATSRAVAGLELLLIRWTLLHTHPGASGDFHDHVDLTGSAYALEHPLQATKQFGPADWLLVREAYLKRFEATLVALAIHARERGVRLVLVTMPFNYRLSPAWKHPQFEAYAGTNGTQVSELLHVAGRLEQAGDFHECLATSDRALALDPGPPLLHYLRAQCLEKLGQSDDAEAAYGQSRERMLGNLGSRLSVNGVIRRVATQLNVPLVDAARIFEDSDHAQGRHFNDGLILDDCHPSPEGHRLIADALAPLL